MNADQLERLKTIIQELLDNGAKGNYNILLYNSEKRDGRSVLLSEQVLYQLSKLGRSYTFQYAQFSGINTHGDIFQTSTEAFTLRLEIVITNDNLVIDRINNAWIYWNNGVILTTASNRFYEPFEDYNPATKKYVDDAISTSIAGISSTSMEIATSLPTENISTSTIYLVKDETASTDTENIYNEYIYINGAWENIGSTKTTVDLSQYSTTEELSQMLSTALRNYLTVADMNAALSNYYTKTATDEAIENAINNIEHPTTDLSNYYNKQEIDTMIGDINSILDAINGEEV